MKFGHDLAKVVNVSDPEWAPYFIQYKTLKQHIKAIRAETDAHGSQDGSPCRSAGGDSSQAGSPAPAGRARATTEDRVGLEDTGAPAAQRKTMSESAPEVAFFRAPLSSRSRRPSRSTRLLDAIKEAEDLYKEMGAAAKAARDDRAARSAQAAGNPGARGRGADEPAVPARRVRLHRRDPQPPRHVEDPRGRGPPRHGGRHAAADGRRRGLPLRVRVPRPAPPNAAAVAASPPFPVLFDRAADGDAPAAKRQKA
ncbi:hypothetical protein JL720_6540 [Aureococcus anophagefferens]|nr:hypothetical protein JL720_6540 [Aureococcus anophagefferens]